MGASRDDEARVRYILNDSVGRYVILGAHLLLDRQIKVTDLRVYALLALLAGRGQACVVEREVLARIAGLSPKTIDRSLSLDLS